MLDINVLQAQSIKFVACIKYLNDLNDIKTGSLNSKLLFNYFMKGSAKS